MGARLGRVRGVAGSAHLGPCLAVTAMTSVLAAADGRRARSVLGVGAAVLAGHLSVGLHNDVVDADRDRRAGREDKPLVADPTLRPAATAAAVGTLAACVPLSLLSGRRAAAEHLAGVALAWAYNARLKATAWSWVPYAGGFALLISFVERGRPGHPPPAAWEVAAAALLGVGAHFANVVPDLHADAGTGVYGLPQRFTRPQGTAVSVVLVLGASGLAALAGEGRIFAGLPAATGILAVGAAAERRHPGALFRSTLAVALVDVALLIGRARTRR